jgi:hypothetical protein
LAKVPERARERYSQLANAEPVDVGIGFSTQAEKVSSKALTNSLADFVYAHRNCKGAGFKRDLPEGYCHIGIHEPNTLPAGHWHGGAAFDTAVAPKELLESRIAQKMSVLLTTAFQLLRSGSLSSMTSF